MWGNMACLVGIHHWSDWEVQDPQRPSEQVRTCAHCHHAQRPGHRAGGKVACLIGVHEWSDLKVQGLQRASEQVRSCTRCPRTKNNAAVVPLRSLFWLGAWMVRYAMWTCSGRRAGVPKFSQRIRRVERGPVTLSQFDRIRPVPRVGA